jgi:hypothetical protein
MDRIIDARGEDVYPIAQVQQATHKPRGQLPTFASRKTLSLSLC